MGGLVLFGYLGLFFLLRYLQIAAQTNPNARPGLLRKGSTQLFAICAIAWITMLVFWPTAQPAPITFPIAALLNFAQYGTPDFTTTFFQGQHIDINDVPRYYGPLWLLLALPEFLFLGLAAGGAYLIVCRPNLDLRWALIGLSAAFPLILIVTMGTPLYDGLRHILFTIPPLVVLSAAGLEALASKTRSTELRRSLIGVTGILLGLTLWDMVRLHPNEYLYFNRLFAGGLKSASEHYQTDYWENSHRQGLKWLDANYNQRRPNRKWRVSAPSKNIALALNPDRYLYEAIPIDADFYLSTTRDDRHKRVPGQIVHTIRRDGVALLYIVRPDSSYRDDPFFEHAGLRQSRLAWLYLQSGAYEKALAAYQQVLKNDPGDPLIYHNIALSHRHLGAYRKAAEFSRRALDLDPRFAKAHLTLGNALLSDNSPAEAILAYQKVLELDSNHPKVHQNLARALRKQGNTEGAIRAYQEALSRQPDTPTIHRELGTLLAEQKRYAEAGKALERAATLDSTRALNWYLLAQTRRLSGRLEGARRSILKALSLDPSNTDYRVEHLNVGRRYQQKGHTQEALSVYREAVQKNPGFPSAHLHLGNLYFGQNHYNRAALAFQNAARLSPKNADIRLKLAFALEKSGQTQEEIGAFRAVLDQQPDNRTARRHLQALHSAPP